MTVQENDTFLQSRPEILRNIQCRGEFSMGESLDS